MTSEISDKEECISNIELVHWVNEEDSMRGMAGERIDRPYLTFHEAKTAILEKGPIIIATDRVDVSFFVLGGRFDDEIMAIRQSGINVRRFLIRESYFEEMFGNFPRCIDMILSNNLVECELELTHLRDFAEVKNVSVEVDNDKEYSRLEVDTVAALQLLKIRDSYLDENIGGDFIFDLGFSVGRLFSSIQNLATLEGKALKAEEMKKTYRDRGKKSGSDKRKKARLNKFIIQIELVYTENPTIRPYETMVLRAAFDLVVPHGTYGHGQFEEYCTLIRSEEPYKTRFEKLFRNSPK